MIISANQPYFSPFACFFYKVYLSDVLVILDEVQFPRGTTWITRNRFKNDQGTLWMTIPVWKKGLGLQKINSVRICYEGRWARKHLDSLKNAYGNAPFFDEHLTFLEKMFSSDNEKIIDFNMEIIRYLVDFFKIDTQIFLQSELEIAAKGDRLIIEICRHLQGDEFLTQSAAGKYLDLDFFRKAGIHLKFFKPLSIIYPQLWGSFIPNLSAFDLVFTCGSKARDVLMNG